MELKITAQDLQNFKPTDEMKEKTIKVFANMAQLQIVKPIVQGIQNKILEDNRFQNCHEEGEIILEAKHSYLMKDSDFNVYHKQCRMEEDRVGLFVENEEFCPLLVAEESLRRAENDFIDVMGAFIGITRSQINMKLKLRKDFVELNLRFMAGFVDSSEKNLKGGLN